MKVRLHGYIFALIIGIACSAAHATTLYNSFGDGDTYGGSAHQLYWQYGDPTTGRTTASKFTVGAGTDYSLDSVTLALKRLNGATNVTICIRNDDGAGHPDSGAPVAVLAIDPGDISGTTQVLTYNSAHPTLAASTTYWLTLQPTTENTTSNANDGTIYWYVSPTTQDNWSDRDYSNGWGAYYVNFGDVAAYRVEATAVPEPSSVAFFGMGLAGLIGAGFRRFKKKS